mmetsp:Transcript_38482/g.86365  ORF Transcript_38482/g.86365 Transcript_38482/m.86365 type:complete len:83 (+) Transcript_38482:62-310(+)
MMIFNFWWSSTFGGALIHTAFSFCPVVGIFSSTTVLLCSSVRCGGALFVGIVLHASNTAVLVCCSNPHANKPDDDLMMIDVC